MCTEQLPPARSARHALPGAHLGAPAPSCDIVDASTRAYGANREGYRLAHTNSHARVSDGPYENASRETRELAQALELAPGATRAQGGGNRLIPEPPDPHRTCFERDLGRIIHASAFRRQAGKAQVFVAPNDIHLRTRLTHAIEVAQVARSIASATGLNTTLTEAIAMGHDCGHGPGGHAAETALGVFLPEGFDHALWGADVTLAPLNLCRETLDGIRQHSWRLGAPSTPEGEAVSWADRIAYIAHDYNDALRAGLVGPHELPEIVAKNAGTDQSDQIDYFVARLIEATISTGFVSMHNDSAQILDAFRQFNYENIYETPPARASAKKMIATLRGLVTHLVAHPNKLPEDAGAYGQETPTHAAVRYVASMSDRFALETARAWDVL